MVEGLFAVGSFPEPEQLEMSQGCSATVGWLPSPCLVRQGQVQPPAEVPLCGRLADEPLAGKPGDNPQILPGGDWGPEGRAAPLSLVGSSWAPSNASAALCHQVPGQFCLLWLRLQITARLGATEPCPAGGAGEPRSVFTPRWPLMASITLIMVFWRLGCPPYSLPVGHEALLATKTEASAPRRVVFYLGVTGSAPASFREQMNQG